MTDFTYELPSTTSFLNGVKTFLKGMPIVKYKEELIEILDYTRCEFDDTGQFSNKRWNATGLNIRFFLPMSVYSKYSLQLKDLNSSLFGICNKVLPPNAGYDILEVSIVPDVLTKQDPLSEIINTVEKYDYLNISEEFIEKGKQMANAYVTLYALENHIRHFINLKLSEQLGDDYIKKINISKKIRDRIEQRKHEEQQKKWLPLRGDNDLYYLDFIELSELIINNWEYFKNLIPNQDWIRVKMADLYDIRCLIAHNSYISKDSIQLLEVTAKQLIAQLYS